MKKFTLITYEKSKVAIFIRGIKYKSTKKDNDADENVNELYNNPNIEPAKKSPFRKLNVKTIENNLRKLNEESLNFDKNKAIQYLINHSGDYDDVYFVSISNYQKYIEYQMEQIQLIRESN